MKKKIPEGSASLFQEYDYNLLDIKRDKSIVMGRLLESGDMEALQWLFKTYAIKDITEFVKLKGYRALSLRTFNFWCLILNIKDYKKPEWLKDKKLLWRF